MAAWFVRGADFTPPSRSTLYGPADFEITPETPRRHRRPTRGKFAPARQ